MGSVPENQFYICTHKPCSLCAKMIINAGFRGLSIKNPYPDPLGDELINEAGLEVCIFKSGCES
jgi:dCMP deaminase